MSGTIKRGELERLEWCAWWLMVHWFARNLAVDTTLSELGLIDPTTRHMTEKGKALDRRMRPEDQPPLSLRDQLTLASAGGTK